MTDDSGATDTASVSVNVANLTPTADFTAPTVVDAGDAVSFDASGSGDLDGTVQHYLWDFDGNGIFDADTPSPAIVRTFPGNGTYTVKLRVTDDYGASADVTQSITVTGAPTASFAVLADSATAGSPVSFDGSASIDTDGTVVSYDWDLDGNGSFETGTGASPSVTKTYPNPGTIVVRLRVTDDQGGQGVATQSVTVKLHRPRRPAAARAARGRTRVARVGRELRVGRRLSGVAGSEPRAGGAPRWRVSAARASRSSGRCSQGLAIGCRSDRAVRCELVLQIGGRKPVTVGRAVVTLRAAGARSVKVKLSTKARRLLRRARSAQVIVSGSATDAAGHTTKLSRMFLLRR